MKESRPLTLVVVLWLLAVVLPLLLVARIDGAQLTTGALLAWSLTAYSASRLAQFSARRRPRLITLTFWVFVYVWLGLAPMLQVATGEFPWPGVYSDETLMLGWLIVLLGLVGFDVAASVFRRRPPTPGPLRARLVEHRFTPRRVIWLGVIMLGLSLLIGIVLGGIATFAGSRNEVFQRVFLLTQSASHARLQFAFTLLRVPPFLALLLVVYLWKHRWPELPRSLQGRIRWLFLALLVPNLVFNNPVHTPRYWLGTMVFSVAFVLFPWHRGKGYVAWTLGFVTLLIVIFPYADLFRFTVRPDVASLVHKHGLPLIYKIDYDGYQQILNATEHVSEHGVGYGRQLLGALLFWVPRSIWTGKPLPSNELVAGASGYSFTNVGMPLWAEAFLDGGIVGVLVVLTLYGALVGTLERFYESARRGGLHPILLIVPVYAAYQPLLLRGALISAVAYLAPILLTLLLATGGRRRPAGQARETLPHAPARTSTHGTG